MQDQADLSTLDFEPEPDPEEFFIAKRRNSAQGEFQLPETSPSTESADPDGHWEIDLAPAPILGDGFNQATPVTQHAKDDFLSSRKRGRRSAKRSVVLRSTWITIDPATCRSWANEIAAKGRYSGEDVDELLARCRGDGDLDELAVNLRRTLEGAGLDSIEDAEACDWRWDSRMEESSCDLAEAVEAVLTRATRLPGRGHFSVEKPDEQKMLQAIARAQQELHLLILASSAAVPTILTVVGSLRAETDDPHKSRLRKTVTDRSEHLNSEEFLAAVLALQDWQDNGRVMDGKRRRAALSSLRDMELSPHFQAAVLQTTEGTSQDRQPTAPWAPLIASLESGLEALVLSHLPYARRFASRSVLDGEDPEDVFQAAFMGLRNSIRRFDPDRGHRFLIYATFWMRQSITRWRMDEGCLVRVPVHRHELLAKLDRGLERLSLQMPGPVSDQALATELELSADLVSRLQTIPREMVIPGTADDWDALFAIQEENSPLEERQTSSLVADLLSTLSEREADVIRRRFGIGLDEEMTLEEIGQLYGVTRERIRQIEFKALRNLSHPARRRALRAALGK